MAGTQPIRQHCMSIQKTTHYLPDKQQVILTGCRAGCRSSQAELYHLYARKMMGVCMWYARNREEAEEVLQDGFIRVFKYINTYTGEGCFESWIRKVMVNTALQQYRNKTPHMWVITTFNSATHDRAEGADVYSNYDERELVSLIQTLPPAYRMVFNLYVFEGMKHREIADALDISEGTSKSNLSDARKILQAALTNKQKIVSRK